VSSNRIIGFHITGKRKGRGLTGRGGRRSSFHVINLEEAFNALHSIYEKYNFRKTDELINKLIISSSYKIFV